MRLKHVKPEHIEALARLKPRFQAIAAEFGPGNAEDRWSEKSIRFANAYNCLWTHVRRQGRLPRGAAQDRGALFKQRSDALVAIWANPDAKKREGLTVYLDLHQLQHGHMPRGRFDVVAHYITPPRPFPGIHYLGVIDFDQLRQRWTDPAKL